MILSADGQCSFCPDYQVKRDGICQECIQQGTSIGNCISDNLILQCNMKDSLTGAYVIQKYLNLSSLQCENSCQENQMQVVASNFSQFSNNEPFSYCRDNRIYVDSSSSDYLELGTSVHPTYDIDETGNIITSDESFVLQQKATIIFERDSQPYNSFIRVPDNYKVIELANISLGLVAFIIAAKAIMDFETPFNISIDNVTFNTYNFNLGSDESILQINPSDSCETYNDINFPLQYPILRKVQFTNILIKNDYQNKDANILYSMKIMKNKIWTSASVTNQNSLATLQQINNQAVYQDTQLTIENITVANVSTISKESNIQSFFSTQLLQDNSIFELSNLVFKNNNILGNQAILIDHLIDQFILRDGIFQSQYFYDNAAFVDCSFARVLTLSNLTFSQMLFVNSTQRGTFLVKIKKILIDEVEQQNSLISQVSMTQQIVVSNNYYYGDCFVFFFDSYFQEDNQTQVEILHSTFDLNFFLTTGLGMVMKVRCNMKNPIYINDTLFQNQTRGSLLFEAGNKDRLDVPLRVIFERVVMNYTISYYRAVVTVRTNTKLYFYNFLAQQSLNIKRGGFVLADYKESYVYCYNCTFYRIIGFNGGVFFVHYGSKIEIDTATFTDCAGVQNGLGSVETDGHFTIKNSILNSTYALKTSVVGITDSIGSTSYFQNVTFISNRILGFSEFQDKYLPAFYLPSFKRDVANIYKRIQVGEKYLTKVMRSNLVFDNCTFISEQRLIDVYLSQVTIQNSIIKDFVINQDEPSYISTTSALLKLENVTFRNGMSFHYNQPMHKQTQLHLNITQLENLQGIFGEDSNIIITNSNFINMQNTDDGGAIRLINSNLTLNGSTFLNNYAVKGGALCVQCSKSKFCEYNILRTFFDQNYALQSGGAIYFSNHAPYIDNSTSTFGLQNYAQYGSNVGSYPVGVRLIKTDETNHIASGQLFTGTFQVELIDVNQNRLNADSISCIICEIGTFSLTFGSTLCNECLSNAECFGGSQVSLKSGYWRSSYYSTQIHPCINSDSCIGGIIHNNTQSSDLLCKAGYGGNLCEKCVTYNGIQYTKLTSKECGQCPEMIFSLLTMIALLLIQLTVAAVVVLFTLHPTLTKFLFGLFNCIEIDSGEYWLKNQLEIQCWNGQHLQWALTIGFPAILMWVVCAPFSLLWFKMIYQGFKREIFYWEYINITRKVLLIIVNVFFSMYNQIFKVLISLLILTCLLQYQKRIRPFQSSLINLIEQKEYMASCSVFFASMFFVNSEISDEIKMVVIVVIVIININFYTLWLLGITNQSKNRFVVMLNVILRKALYPFMRFELLEYQNSLRSFGNKSSFYQSYIQKSKDVSNTFDLSQCENLQDGKINKDNSNFSIMENHKPNRRKSLFSKMKTINKKTSKIQNPPDQKLEQIMPSQQSNALTFYNPEQTENNSKLLFISGGPTNSNVTWNQNEMTNTKTQNDKTQLVFNQNSKNTDHTHTTKNDTQKVFQKITSLRKKQKKSSIKTVIKSKSRAVNLDKNGYDKTNDLAYGDSTKKGNENQTYNFEKVTHYIAPKIQQFNQDQTLNILNINYADESRDKVQKFEKISEYQFFQKQPLNLNVPKKNSRNKKGVEIVRQGESFEILNEAKKSRYAKFDLQNRKISSQSPERQNQNQSTDRQIKSKSSNNKVDGSVSNQKMFPMSKEIISRAFYHSTQKQREKN
eukprot:403360653